MNPGDVGLCERCVFRRTVVSGRGSAFVLCERSRVAPEFPRYPILPVVRCGGFEPIEPHGSPDR